MDQAGKLLVFLGIFLAIIGGIIWFFGNKLTWFGHLPGDIRVEKENVKFYAPFVSMLLFSIVLSLLIWIIRKFL